MLLGGSYAQSQPGKDFEVFLLQFFYSAFLILFKKTFGKSKLILNIKPSLQHLGRDVVRRQLCKVESGGGLKQAY